MDMFPNYTRNHCCVITNQILVDKTKLTNSVNKLYTFSKTSYTEAVLNKHTNLDQFQTSNFYVLNMLMR